MRHKDASKTAVNAREKKEKLACIVLSCLTHSEENKGLKVQNSPRWPCGRTENALSLLSIFISSSIDKSWKDKYAWRLKEVERGRVRSPGFSQQAHSVHCMLIKHSSAEMTKSCLTTAGWVRVFNLHFATSRTLSSPSFGCRFYSLTFFTIQSWLFLVLHVTDGSKYILLRLSYDISQQDLKLPCWFSCAGPANCSKKKKKKSTIRGKWSGSRWVNPGISFKN